MTTSIRKANPKALKVHELANIIPEMRPMEWEPFYQDIAFRGIKVPIEVLGDGTVVDGRHRLKAALQLGLAEVPIVDAPLNGDTPEEYMIKAALLRRHLTDDQWVAIAEVWRQQNKQDPQISTRDEKGRILPSTPHGVDGSQTAFAKKNPTTARAAQKFKVSRKKLEKARVVGKYNSALLDRVRTGDKSLNAAYKEVRKATEAENAKPFPPGKYEVIYADPPWQYGNSGLAGSAEDHYSTLSMDELKKLRDSVARQVTDLAADHCVLFLWVTAPFLPEALQLCEAWGFDYKTHFVWLKDKSTYGKLGFYVRSQHELLFVATKGSCLPNEGSLEPSVIYAEKGKHSAKPELTYTIIEKMYPGPYIELFATHPRQGWQSWGTL